MREEFQKFKINTRDIFLNELIRMIGKNKFDYMLIEEIRDYIVNGVTLSNEIILNRRNQCSFEMVNDDFEFSCSIPENILFEQNTFKNQLHGDVCCCQAFL